MQDKFIQADQNFTEIVEQITSDQWQHMVPATPEWTVQQLVGHVTENNRAVCKAIGVNDDLIANIDQEPADAWRESAADAENIARTTTDPGRIVSSPLGDMPASQLLQMSVVDRTIHAFDLAQAIGVDPMLDPEIVQLAFDTAAPDIDNLRKQGIFGDAYDIPEDAPVQDKLLAMTGRNPSIDIV